MESRPSISSPSPTTCPHSSPRRRRGSSPRALSTYRHWVATVTSFSLQVGASGLSRGARTHPGPHLGSGQGSLTLSRGPSGPRSSATGACRAGRGRTSARGTCGGPGSTTPGVGGGGSSPPDSTSRGPGRASPAPVSRDPTGRPGRHPGGRRARRTEVCPSRVPTATGPGSSAGDVSLRVPVGPCRCPFDPGRRVQDPYIHVRRVSLPDRETGPGHRSVGGPH